MADEPACLHCDDTGYIGSPLEIGYQPCTDCEIWWNKIVREDKDGR